MPSSPATQAIGPDQIRPLRRAEYDQLVALGAFAGERLELLQGALVEMSPPHAPHAATIARLTKLLVRRTSDRYELRFQLPLAIADDSEPEPDVAIVAAGDYRHAHPTTALLVIEIADSSLARDRRKAALYAAAGIPECWIVDLTARVVEVSSAPSASGYAVQRIAAVGEALRPIAVPELELAITELVLT
ncbi:MAG TPA: Uma2 family endonuclease [Kofleriaceae bacterium]|jgi:Uma2 family endonuclease|nr:Uma2 family endonuclease [Kofleriaceae bacterium]